MQNLVPVETVRPCFATTSAAVSAPSRVYCSTVATVSVDDKRAQGKSPMDANGNDSTYRVGRGEERPLSPTSHGPVQFGKWQLEGVRRDVQQQLADSGNVVAT